MRAVILYRPNTEFARRVEEYAHDYERGRGQTIELLDADTKGGIELAELYGVMDYPTLMVIRDDGQVMKDWQGVDSLPLMNELASYVAA